MAKKICKTRPFNVKVETLDPTGIATNSEELTIEILDDEFCSKKERLIIHIGEYSYYINKEGLILEKLN